MRKRLIMGVVLARYLPNSAGHQLSVLHWLIGFREMGWDVWIVESLRSEECVDEEGRQCDPLRSRNHKTWRTFVAEHNFRLRESLFIDGVTPDPGALERFADGAELFLNYAGQFTDRHLLGGVQATAYLDVDPGYTQTWAMGYGCDMHFEPHDFHLTIGAAWGKPWCRIPPTGHDWLATVPPVSISLYSQRSKRQRMPDAPWTTITHWFGPNEVEWDGTKLRGKRESFLPLLSLPEATGRPFLVATDLRPDWDDHEAFVRQGWAFCRTDPVCESLGTYLDFIQKSTGEIGVPKDGYVATKSGWLSDRSMAYLACGKPVVARDTGWKDIIGEFPGLRAFESVEEAAAAIKDVEDNYEEACRSASELAERRFSAQEVLLPLLARMGLKCGREELQRFRDSVQIPSCREALEMPAPSP